jgi:hypothetical protein
MAKWPQVVTESMRPFALCYMVNFHNASVPRSQQATPSSLFTGQDPPCTLQDFVSLVAPVMSSLSDYRVVTTTRNERAGVG